MKTINYTPRSIKCQLKNLNNAPYLNLTIYDEDVSLQEIKSEILTIISEFKKELTYIDWDEFIKRFNRNLDSLDFSELTEEEKAWVRANKEVQNLSTYKLTQLLKERNPQWFENPIKVEKIEDLKFQTDIEDAWTSKEL